MHIASLIYIYLLLRIVITKRKIKNIFVELVALYSFTYISVEAGNFINLNGIQIGYARFVELFLLLTALIIIMCGIVQKRSSKLDQKQIKFSILCVLAGVIHLIWQPTNILVVNGDTLIDAVWNGNAALQYPVFSATTVSSFIAYVLFLTILYAVFFSFSRNDYMYILNVFVNYSKILIMFGYIEFLSKLLLSSQLYSKLLILFWGTNGSITYSDEVRNGLPMLYGWTQEPSHFAYTLFIIMVAMLAQHYRDQSQGKWIIASGLLLILTMAFSALLFSATFMAIYYVYKNKGTKYYLRRIFGAVGIAVSIAIAIWVIVSTGIFAGSFFGDRLSIILEELPRLLKLDIQDITSLEYSSQRVRLVSSFTTLKLIVYRPLFGLGIGTLTSHGSSATILSSIGVLGTYMWLKALFGGSIKKVVNIDQRAYKMMIASWFVMGIFMSHFLGMLYGGENYILIVSYAVLSEKSKSRRHKRNS